MFGIDSYTRVLKSADAAGYEFLPFRPQRPRSGGIYLRHDVDYSMEYALEIAKVNAQHGAQATFFVLLQSEIYNAFSPRNREILEEIAGLGHHIGLHVRVPDTSSFDVEAHLKREWSMLQTIFPESVPVFSWHNPTAELIAKTEQAPSMEGLTNAYSAPFTKEAKYLSDSNLRFTPDQFIEAITGGSPRAIQLLIHPLNWVAGGNNMGEILAKTWGQIIKEREIDVSTNAYYRSNLSEGLPADLLNEFCQSILNLMGDSKPKTYK